MSKRLIAALPSNYICPGCGQCRTSQLQWGIDNTGRALCRKCLHDNPALLIGPLAMSMQRRGFTVAQELINDAVQAAQDCATGYCCLCYAFKTKRIEGYCFKCRLKMLVLEHGGDGAYRIDKRGRIFAVRSKLLRAEYCWGLEQLTFGTSWPSDQATFDTQRAYMFNITCDMLDARPIQQLRRQYENAFDDIHLDAIGKAVLSYDSSKDKKLEKDMYSHVRRVLTRALRKYEQREAPEQLSDAAAERIAAQQPEDIGPDPAEQLSKLGLTEFEIVLLRLWFVDGLTGEQIGDRYGWTKQTTSNKIRAIKLKCTGPTLTLMQRVKK